MERRDCDAVVLFGVTGDLCYRKIIPALYHLVRHNLLNVPVIGVARQGWKIEQLAQRIRDSLKQFVPSADEAVIGRLIALLRYVDGDYSNRATFESLRQALGGAQRPLNYLAIPPSMFPVVIEHLSATQGEGARIVVEKPFGRDLASARALNHTLHEHFPESSIFRIDHYLGKEAVQNILFFRFANSFLEPVWNHDGGDPRGRWPRQVLRGSRGDPRRGAEPPAADHGAADDGATGHRCRRVGAR